MSRDDLIRFARRDWASVAAAKERHWLRQRRTSSFADLLGRADDLLRHARAVSRVVSSPADRHADWAVHHRVGLALGAVTRASR